MDNLPVFANGAAIGLIRGVSMSDAPGIHDLTIASGAIAAIRPSRMQHAQWLVLPGLSNMHVHADRSFDGADGSGRTFPETVAQAASLRRDADEEAFFQRAGKLFERALMHGTTRLRTHTDVDDLVGKHAIAGILAARALRRNARSGGRRVHEHTA